MRSNWSNECLDSYGMTKLEILLKFHSPDCSGILICLSGKSVLMTKLEDKKDIAESGKQLLKN